MLTPGHLGCRRRPPRRSAGSQALTQIKSRRMRIMDHQRSIQLVRSSILAVLLAALLPVYAFADAQCSGHLPLSMPRPEASCRNVLPRIFVSPDKALRALVLPSDVSLDTTPDMESRVVIRSSHGDTLTSEDYSSPRGMNGHYVYRAKWSPDSQFFVYSMISSGGHSPGRFQSWSIAARPRASPSSAT
jgi:hypothetical protein